MLYRTDNCIDTDPHKMMQHCVKCVIATMKLRWNENFHSVHSQGNIKSNIEKLSQHEAVKAYRIVRFRGSHTV
jgi:hypothetical protein